MRSDLFVGPVACALGETLHKQLEQLRGAAAAIDGLVDTSSDFSNLWLRVRACLTADATDLRVI